MTQEITKNPVHEPEPEEEIGFPTPNDRAMTALQNMMLERSMPRVVREMAHMALDLGGKPEDAARTVVQAAGLDIFAWFAVCQEMRSLNPKRKIGFIQ